MRISRLIAAALCGVLITSGAALAGYEEAAEYSAAHRGISLLILVDGKVVHESYPGETVPRLIRPGPDWPFQLASGTKSFWGVAAAAAVQDGILTLDEKVSDTIGEWRKDPARAEITLRQLLTLTSGIPGSRRGRGIRVPSYADALDTDPVAAPGESFSYGPIPFQIFGAVLRRKLQERRESPTDYLKRRVLDPIGVEWARWAHGRDGNPHLPSGAALTAGNWARFGEFVRLGGNWQGQPLVDRATLEACFEGTKANPAYGVTWWLNRPVPEAVRKMPPLDRASDLPSTDPAIPKDLVMAAGAGDQRLYISRDKRMVVVRQAWGIARTLRGRDSGFSDVEFWRAMGE